MSRSYRRAFAKALKHFCKETSVVGLQYVFGSKRTLFEKCTWWLLLLFLLATVLLMVFHTVNDFAENPLVTSLETTNYHIKNVEFPGISICNINKISKKRAVDYAKLLSARSNASFDLMLDGIKLLGTLYDFEVENADDLLNFQIYLDKFGAVNKSSVKNYLYDIMKTLSTPCEELLLGCCWKGQNRNCSEMFRMRETHEGFCCTFNYLRPDPLDTRSESSKAPQTLSRTGFTEGLIVTIRNQPDDYFYPLVSSVGVNIHIFDPFDYPDVLSGSFIQALIGVGTESFLSIDASTIYSHSEIRKYPIRIRKCIFDDEVETAFGSYSSSNCLLQCRVKSIIALCQCIPFMILWPDNVSHCTLSDVPCLNKYQVKWQSFYPEDFNTDELEREKQDSLYCENCYSACSFTSYHASTNSAPLNMRGPGGQEEYPNYSVIRIYYGHPYTKLYSQDVLFYWFEILSNIGGLLGIFLGISIVSVVELLYFISFRFILIVKSVRFKN